jgi:hypothetical protein
VTTARQGRRRRRNGDRWEAADVRFPVMMKYGGLICTLVAFGFSLAGFSIATPLVGLFGSMMGLGQVIDAIGEGARKAQEAAEEDLGSSS